jgi:hypothetical protein
LSEAEKEALKPVISSIEKQMGTLARMIALELVKVIRPIIG